ncbi:zeta toxin family protein [Streptomyces sp. NPDC050485]|uniref:zeta toxin family protein n=1 Tax=Streptomyces sp. NPDC050485 TaxID=3365617 RepID=UPI0037926F32
MSSPSQPLSLPEPPAGADPVSGWPDAVLAATVLPGVVSGAVPHQEHPVVVLVAGQPGSGKSLVADLVHAALGRRGGAVRVDHDQYKAHHPHYRGFLAEDVRSAGVRVRPETYRWQAEVEAHVRAHRYDAVVETPLTDPAAARRSVAAYRQAGYRVEVVVLAVPEAVSQLGVLDRYLRLAEAGRARYVGWQNHDGAAAGLLASLEVIEAECLADRVVVVRRDAETAGEFLYDNELAPAGHWQRPAGAVQAVVTERARPWTPQETGVFRRQLADADRRAHRTAPDGQLPADWGLAVQRDAERAAALAEPVRRIAQPRKEAPGVDYHRLSAEEHAWIFDELIAPDLLEQLVPQERPVAVFVMGQPGAGTTGAAHLVRRALRGRPVVIRPDSFLAEHPDYRQLVREEPYQVEERLRADYRAWQARAEAYVRGRRSDAVIEITPVSAAEFLAGAAVYREAGYRVELAVLAVRAADSRQASVVRYARTSRNGSRPARIVPAYQHDLCLDVLGRAMAAAEHSGLVDSVVVMRRDTQALLRTERAPGRGQPSGAVGVLAAEQLRPYTPDEAARFMAEQRRLRAALPHVRDELVAISRLARPLMSLRLQPPRLASPVENPALLPVQQGRAPGPYCSAASSFSSRAS